MSKIMKITDRLGITEAAVLIGRRYAKTRDMMLAGELGKAEKNGRTLTVSRKDVEKYLEKRVK